MIATRLATVTDAGLRTSLTDLLGTVGIANAKLAYHGHLALCRRSEITSDRELMEQPVDARRRACGCGSTSFAFRRPHHRRQRRAVRMVPLSEGR